MHVAEVVKNKKPVAKTSMEINNKLLLCLCEEASLQVRAKIISPAKATTLATTPKASELWHSTPTALAICENEVDELLVFLCSPWAFLHPKFVTAGLPPHSTNTTITTALAS
ncbi:hypothetical protein CR513_42901, partial [Mucuna pruriens]